MLTQHARPGVGQTTGRFSGGAGPGPADAMAKTVAYFYDPDVGNFHYGEGTSGARGVSGGGFEAGPTTPGMRLMNSFFSHPQGLGTL